MHKKQSLRELVIYYLKLVNFIRIYFIKSKKKIVWDYCYQNYYLNEEKTLIEDHKRSEQIVSKIDSDIDMMIYHGVKYSIIEFYPDYFIELRIFEDKLKKMSSKLKKAQDNDDFIKYPEIEEEGYSLLNELKSSKVFRDFEVHYSQTSLYIRSNEVSINCFIFFDIHSFNWWFIKIYLIR